MTTYDLAPLDRMRFGIVLNDLDEGALHTPHDLAGWTLDRATPHEITLIRPWLHSYAGAHDGLNRPSHESHITPAGSGFHFEPLSDSTQWRYSVVRPTPAATLTGAQLAEALRISDADIWVELWDVAKAPTSEGPATSTGGSPGQCVQFFARMSPDARPQQVDVDDVAEVVSLRAALDEAEFPGIVRAIRLFRELDVVPEHSSTKLLGYFGVLESLLSHAPAPQDPVDSITRQLKRNLTLLNNRLPAEKDLGLRDFPGTSGPDQLIGRLYSYRSAIAHGGDGAEHLAWLEQHRPDAWRGWWERLWLHRYMRLVTQRVLVSALREPRLVTDVKGR